MSSSCFEIPSQNFIVYSGISPDSDNDLSKSSTTSSSCSNKCISLDRFSSSATSLVSNQESCNSSEEKVVAFYNRDPIFITKYRFGCLPELDGDEEPTVYLYHIENSNGMVVKIITYGARVHDIIVPDRNSEPKSIVLNVPGLEDYKTCTEKYLNASIGRSAQIIPNATFCINGKSFDLTENHVDGHHLNGGLSGFYTKNWLSEVVGSDVLLTLISHDGDEGYPGSVIVQARFNLNPDNSLKITYTARTTSPTPFDISNRIFMNLSGDKDGNSLSLYDHIVQVNANQYLEIEEDDQVQHKNLKNVSNTEYDLRSPQTLGVAMKRHPNCGYENLYKVVKSKSLDLSLIAKLIHPTTGIALEYYSNQDFVWFNTCNNYPDPDENIFPDYDLDLLELEPFPLKPNPVVEEKDVLIENIEEKVSESQVYDSKSKDLQEEQNENSVKEQTVEDVEEEEEERPIQNPVVEVPVASDEPKTILPKHSNFTLHGSEMNLAIKCEDRKLSIEERTEIDLQTVPFLKHAGFYLQPQNFPSAVKYQRLYPSIMLNPGQVYNNETLLKFGIHTGPVLEKEGKRLPVPESEENLGKKPNSCCNPDCPRRFLETCCLYCEKHCK